VENETKRGERLFEGKEAQADLYVNRVCEARFSTYTYPYATAVEKTLVAVPFNTQRAKSTTSMRSCVLWFLYRTVGLAHDFSIQFKLSYLSIHSIMRLRVCNEIQNDLWTPTSRYDPVVDPRPISVCTRCQLHSFPLRLAAKNASAHLN
jgi:hypothetical protein